MCGWVGVCVRLGVCVCGVWGWMCLLHFVCGVCVCGLFVWGVCVCGVVFVLCWFACVVWCVCGCVCVSCVCVCVCRD